MIIFLLFLFLLFPQKILAVEPTITDFWNQKAEFKYSFKLTAAGTGWPSGFTGGAHVEVVGNDWYLFTRKVNWGMKPEYCHGIIDDTLSMEIRKSSDEGRTWSHSTDMVINTPNTPWECAVTDGDAFYNPTENKWHYLSQCLSREGHWSGCHFTRNGTDPFGLFTPDQNNPVITPGEIWSKICTNPNSDCYKLANYPISKITDEGTFDIFDFQNGYYFIDFHGFNNARGYRGIAKTKDFNSWENINNDATLDLKDALSFSTHWDQNGPIGFGAGSILKNNGYFYLISEAADKNLGCTPGQNWVIGMFRSTNIASTSWEKLPAGNPFFTPNNFPTQDPNPLPCYPAYSKIFTDATGKTYLHSSMSSYDQNLDGIYFYELKFKQNNIPGDYNSDGMTDLADFSIWKSKYLAGQATLVDFVTWKNAYLQN